MNVAIDLPDEAEDPVINFMVSFKKKEEPTKKPFRRQLGALKNKDFVTVQSTEQLRAFCHLKSLRDGAKRM